MTIRLVSSVQATMASVSGFIIATSCHDVMTDRHWLATQYVWFAATYMVYDLCAMYLCHWHRCLEKGHVDEKKYSLRSLKSFLRRDFLMVLHHVAIVTILLPVTVSLRRGLGDFFLGCLLMTELSTPFLSLGKALYQLEKQNTVLYKVNGLLVLLAFFLCRILVFPYMYWAYSKQYSIPAYMVPFHIPLHCNVGNLAIMAPQLFWFSLLLKKAKRLFSSPKGTDHSTKHSVNNRKNSD
uniref:TLC domain containing 3A n=2 Tax=Latimeria chalumnae TaxID=7897 RepID=H3AGH5_LATCH|nr:PREDICTED: protein FAM57A isoform X2 [Latimeria chalumnae]|eukprot:XP_006002389.1 PREDICTED: protein FAM57A isoform X2 [Latimeria chalumnae]